MRLLTAADRSPILTERLTEIWYRSVRATHLFLSDKEIEKIKKYVPEAIKHVSHLIIAESDTGRKVGFMGIEEQRLEMLFLLPEERGNGLGKQMVQYGIEKYGVHEVTVNEQNPQAAGFYSHMGFRVYKRMDMDEQGNPYPLLYMKLETV
ncbi:MAG: GNAT family N-acetyltransferase [Eubacteriales bacterium]|nr:GNAT family N-acetyltransferase [Eubacteriales bacterium]